MNELKETLNQLIKQAELDIKALKNVNSQFASVDVAWGRLKAYKEVLDILNKENN